MDERYLQQKIVVRDEMVAILRELRDLDDEFMHNKPLSESNWNAPGLYLDGPAGIGKSFVCYFIVCCLRTLGWIVPYIVCTYYMHMHTY